jgi:drug/metabolite transporter (DMT)-like permease
MTLQRVRVIHHIRHRPAVWGGVLALGAAVLFGISTPLIQHWGRAVGPFTTAVLLYVGAALVALYLRQPATVEAGLQRRDWGRLTGMAVLGSVLAPAALAWGLQRTSATSASLVLTLEAFFTAALAWRLYGETWDKRVTAAMILMFSGGVLLVVEQATGSVTQLGGMLAVLCATIAWGVDNALSRALADRDPAQVVCAKAGLGSLMGIGLALVRQEPLPPWNVGLGLLLIGATGYGWSLHLYLLAQRRMGAARTGSVFAMAPFIGAIAAYAWGDRSGHALYVGGAAALMWLGVCLHLLETHDHPHVHTPEAHDHAHRHDDGHHTHPHEVMPTAAHSHWHEHTALTHSHAHTPDLHHQHAHR